MSEEKLEQVNIKKKKLGRSIYFGVAEDTGELISIESAERGLACNCLCPACGTRLKAQKGEIKKYHFAHETNKECLYSAEVSVYTAMYDLLKKQKEFWIPDAVLSFHSGKESELIREGGMVSFTDVEFVNDLNHYPPTLYCIAGDNRFQIILNMEHYFSKSDYEELKKVGQKNDMAIVVVDIADLDAINTVSDLEMIINKPDHKHWIYNRLVEKWDQRYREIAVEPPKFGEGYVCMAQQNQFRNVYSARLVDCMHCRYCYDYREKAFCLGHSRIDHISDFAKDRDLLEKEFVEKNGIKPIKRIHEYLCPRCNAPMKRRTGSNGVFAGCSKYPACKGTRPVEQTTEQVIIYPRRRW